MTKCTASNFSFIELMKALQVRNARVADLHSSNFDVRRKLQEA
jgi:hypothetical protein